MKIFPIAVLAALAVSAAPLAMAQEFAPLNSFGVYGNVNTLGGNAGKTTGGVGVQGRFFTDNFLLSANFHHEFGSSFSDTDVTGGSSNGVGVKIGYLIPLSQNLRVGPYLGYQYQRWTIDGSNSVSAHLSNNAIGGGGYLAFASGPLTVTGNVGYLDGVSATLGASNGTESISATTNRHSLNDLQVGLQGDYAISGPWYAFASFKLNHYMDNGSTNTYQEGVGLGYSF